MTAAIGDPVKAGRRERLPTARRDGEMAEATARKIVLLMDLLRGRALRVSELQRRFARSERQMLRDLQELRALGKHLGFAVGKRDATGSVRLTLEATGAAATGSAALAGAEVSFRNLVVELFRAFGEPLRGYVEGLAGGGGAAFLQVVMPQLAAGSEVGAMLEQLRAARHACARVRFRYKGKEQEVEPSHVLVRSGRYYLVARRVTPTPEGWRHYSLDLLRGRLQRMGTFRPRLVPPEFASRDVLGWFGGKKRAIEVTVSAKLASAAVSRRWQRAQTSRENDDGTVTLRFVVGDVDEVVRWAIGFGAEAWVSAPEDAVARARAVAKEIARRYG